QRDAAASARRAVGRRIDGAREIPNDRCLEAEIDGVFRRPLHAEVAREPAYEDPLDAAFAQVSREPGRRPLAGRVPVVPERAIRSDVAVGAFANDRGRVAPRQVRMEARPRGILDAVIRPEYLLVSVEVDRVERTPPGMRRCERDVPGGMPVLRCDD